MGDLFGDRAPGRVQDERGDHRLDFQARHQEAIEGSAERAAQQADQQRQDVGVLEDIGSVFRAIEQQTAKARCDCHNGTDADINSAGHCDNQRHAQRYNNKFAGLIQNIGDIP